MPKRQPKKSTETTTKMAGSAPELPAAIAKQYGLTHRLKSASKQSTQVTKSAGKGETVTADSGVPNEDTAGAAKDNDEDSAASDSALLGDPKTEAAVDSIVAAEGDALLAAEDALKQGKTVQPAPRSGFWHHIGHFFKAWWGNPWARWLTIIVLFCSIATIILLPTARYFVLNGVGVRSSVQIQVVDETTRLPLKNVFVQIDGQKAQTAVDGRAHVRRVRLGPQTITIQRLAFRTIKKEITVGWGSNPQPTFELAATGLQYTIITRDYVSGGPLADVEVSANGLNALSDKKGVITFTVSDRDPQDLSATLSKKGYLSQKLVLHPMTPQAGNVTLVPAGKDFFISNQTGTYDLYSANVDGSDKKAVLKGSGNETAPISLVTAPTGDWVALITTRDGTRSKEGYLLRSITLVNQAGTTVSTVERGEQIQPIDWIGTKVIYVVTVAGASAADSQRSRLISYDYATNSRVQLATANQFNGVQLMNGTVYYVIAGTDPAVRPALAKVKSDGTGRQTIWEQQIWSAWRSTPTTLALQTPDGWFTYAGSGSPTKTTIVPSQNRRFTPSADSSTYASIDIRDGKSIILSTDAKTGKETQLVSADGITEPLRWLNDSSITYRVVTNGETADYIVSTTKTVPRKITDVTNTFGFTRY